MRKYYIFLLTVSLFLLADFCRAQAPRAVNYQAIARDYAGNPYANRNISLRFSVNQGINPGFSEYRETQNATTNQFGLFTVKIGFGDPITPGTSLANVNWATGDRKSVV